MENRSTGEDLERAGDIYAGIRDISHMKVASGRTEHFLFPRPFSDPKSNGMI